MSERPSTVAAMFASTVERVGDRLALVDGPDRRTWDELAGDVHRLAGTLAARGVTPGDGVALVLGNDRDFVTTFLAIQVLGAMAVPLNPQFTPDELGQHLAGCDVAGIVADPGSSPSPTSCRCCNGPDRVTAGGTSWVADVDELDSSGNALRRRSMPSRGRPGRAGTLRLLVGVDGHAEGHDPHEPPT